MSNYSTATPFTSSAAFSERIERLKQQARAEAENIKNQDGKILDRSVDLKYYKIEDQIVDRSAQNLPKPSMTASKACDTGKTSTISLWTSPNPDGLDSQIRGKYANALKTEPLLLTARAWGVHPAKLTMAIKAKGMEFVLKEIEFVAKNDGIKSRAGYLSKLLAV